MVHGIVLPTLYSFNPIIYEMENKQCLKPPTSLPTLYLFNPHEMSCSFSTNRPLGRLLRQRGHVAFPRHRRGLLLRRDVFLAVFRVVFRVPYNGYTSGQEYPGFSMVIFMG